MRTLFVALAVSALAIGCSDSSGPSGEANIHGTYAMHTVNGQSLPFAVIVLGTEYRLEITAGSLTVNANNTYTLSTTVSETEAGTTVTVTETSSGTWTRANNAVTFTDGEDGGSITGAAGNGTITVVVEGLTVVFRK